MSGHNPSLGREEAAWELDVLPAQPATQKKYKCPQCPSSFKRPENLKRHQRGHGEDRRFVCQICDKSFARSDVLGRHVATHISRERRDDNSHRRRACRECARVRERCSRGEPCRRCTTKALCCVYPEESQFKIMMPHNRGSSISELDDYDETRVDSSGPDSALGSSGEALLLDYGSSQWQVEGSPGSLQEQYILSPSVFPHNCPSPCLASHHEAHFESFFRYDALLPQDEGLYARSASGISMNNMEFITSDTEPDGVPGAYYQTVDTPSKLTSSLGVYQPSTSAEFQGDYTDGLLLDHEHPNTTFGAGTSSFGTHSAVLGQPEILDFSNTPASQESLSGVQVSNINFDNGETRFHSLQTPWFPMTDLKAYDSVTTAFAGSSQDQGPVVPFDASITAPRAIQHDYFPRVYSDDIEHHENRNDGTLEAHSGFGACFESLYVQ